MQEPELVARARAGDESAFSAIVDSEKERARAVAWRLTRDPVVADEIVHEAFVRLHRALPEFRQSAAVATWLYRTIINLSHDRARALARQANTLSLAEVEHMPTPDAPPDAMVEAAERKQCVDAAVAALPPGMRDVVVLRYTRGLGYDEIAEVLQCAPGTVASRIHRALRAIGVLLATKGIREGSL